MQLRFATGGAAEGWAQVQTSAGPFLVSPEEAVLHDIAHHPATLASDRSHRISAVDPRGVPAPGLTPSGLSVLPRTAVAPDHPR